MNRTIEKAWSSVFGEDFDLDTANKIVVRRVGFDDTSELPHIAR